MITFDTFESRTEMKASLVMQSALSVGARSSLDPTGTDLPVLKGADGLPFIPGSSIKGVIRSQVERILRSIDPKYGLSACDPLSDQCVKPEDITGLQDGLRAQHLSPAEYEKKFSKAVWDKSCTVCRLFGSQWFSSRLFFKDASMLNSKDLPYVTQVRDGVGIDRDLGTARPRIKYDFEVVVSGACFQIEILAENIERWEIGLLLGVLGFWEQGSLAVGGKSTRGPGWGKLENLTIGRVEQSDLLDYLTTHQLKSVDRAQFNQAFQDELKKGANHA